MSDFDHLDLDGRLLQTFLAVVAEGSVTRAAERLGVTQSAVSHMLDKLRTIVGAPLFVKSGRGIVATPHAEALALRARSLLDAMHGFAAADHFDPARLAATITIAANELQRDLLLPALLRKLRAQAPGIALRVIPSGLPDAAMLREERCEILITPRPPEGTDIMHRRLYEDPYRVFYDAGNRVAPASLEAYLEADHVTVVHERRGVLDIDRMFADRGVRRRFAVTVPGFSGLAPFLRASPYLATMPGMLGIGLLRGFASCDTPLECPPMPMYMVWHLRHQHDPVQAWVRREIEGIVEPAIAAARAALG